MLVPPRSPLLVPPQTADSAAAAKRLMLQLIRIAHGRPCSEEPVLTPLPGVTEAGRVKNLAFCSCQN